MNHKSLRNKVTTTVKNLFSLQGVPARIASSSPPCLDGQQITVVNWWQPFFNITPVGVGHFSGVCIPFIAKISTNFAFSRHPDARCVLSPAQHPVFLFAMLGWKIIPRPCVKPWDLSTVHGQIIRSFDQNKMLSPRNKLMNQPLNWRDPSNHYQLLGTRVKLRLTS